MSFQPEPFTPKWRNPHLQSIAANVWRSTEGVAFKRVRIDTPDGDFLDLDFAQVEGHPLPDDAPLVLGLHGLEGNARRGYLCETWRQLAQRGVRAVGMNYRSCSGEPNRTATLYHSGATADVALVVNWLRDQFPDVALGAVGFSLGANMLLKYLGERGDGAGLTAASAVSPPFDLVKNAGVFDQGVGRLYAAGFLRSLHAKVRTHADVIRQRVDIEAALASRTFTEFDNRVTAPLGGFDSAEDYYRRVSSAQFLPGIRVPTLILRALDDPFFRPDDIPHNALTANDCLQAALTPHGGHVAFFEGTTPRSMTFWAERQSARFLAQQLVAISAE